MRRGDAEKLIGTSDLRPADRLVFLRLLRRADNNDCSMPAKFTPSLERLAAETGLHKSTVARSLAHLELHRWVQRQRTKGGRKRKDGRTHRTQYELLCCGKPLPCGCSKQSHHATVSGTKTVAPRDSETVASDPEFSQVSRPFALKGFREGGNGREGVLPPVPRLPVDSFWHQAMNKLYDEER